jgi:hypothetical protein
MQDLSAPKSENSWRDLYLAALFEIDRDRLRERIAEAENALALRARELFHNGDNVREQRSIDAAMLALRALRNTYRFK